MLPFVCICKSNIKTLLLRTTFIWSASVHLHQNTQLQQTSTMCPHEGTKEQHKAVECVTKTMPQLKPHSKQLIITKESATALTYFVTLKLQNYNLQLPHPYIWNLIKTLPWSSFEAWCCANFLFFIFQKETHTIFSFLTMWRLVNMEGSDIVEEVGVGKCRRIVTRGNIQPRPRTETRAPWGQWRTRFLSTHLANTREQTDQNIQ